MVKKTLQGDDVIFVFPFLFHVIVRHAGVMGSGATRRDWRLKR